jgi:hypothetical protein
MLPCCCRCADAAAHLCCTVHPAGAPGVKELQGLCIPRLVASGLSHMGCAYFVATEYVAGSQPGPKDSSLVGVAEQVGHVCCKKVTGRAGLHAEQASRGAHTTMGQAKQGHIGTDPAAALAGNGTIPANKKTVNLHSLCLPNAHSLTPEPALHPGTVRVVRVHAAPQLPSGQHHSAWQHHSATAP